MNSMMMPNLSHKQNQVQNWFMRVTRTLLVLSFVIGGCVGASPSSHMPALLEQETNPNSVVQAKISETPGEKLPVGLVVVPDVVKTDPPTTLSDNSLARFTDRTKSKLENTIPLDIQEVVRLESFHQEKIWEQLRALSKDEKVEFVILILTSSEEVKTPAYLDASAPDVGILPGNEIENY
ncbi:MAG: hypothetical protein JSU59_00975, partial [Nitrospirota bacterium]